MARKATKRKAKPIDAMPPTPEQAGRAEYAFEASTERGQVTKGHFRRVRQLEALTKQGLFGEREAAALHRYRYWCDLVAKSPLRDSLDKDIRAPSEHGGMPPAVVDAWINIGAVDGALGQIRDICRSVIVEDMSPSEWAMQKGGAIDDCRDVGGARICRLRPHASVLRTAQLELKMAAGRVLGELEA